MSRHSPPLAAALLISALVCLVVSAASLGTACADGPTVQCDAAIDCGVRETCRDGQCVDEDGGEGEGEGEGEGDIGERAIIADACAQLIACGLAGPPLETCVTDNEDALVALRERGTAECTDAADAFIGTMTCAAEQSCEVLLDTNDGGLLAQACPAFAEFRALLSICDGGEGEGEGEPPPNECAGQAAFAPAQTTDTIVAAVGNSEETSAALCGGTEQALRLLLEVSGNLEAVTGGFASIDGITAVDLVDIVAAPAARQVSATACIDQNFSEGFIAVALIVDGLLTNSVCGFVQAF